MVNATDDAIYFSAMQKLYEKAIKKFPKELDYLTFEKFYDVARYSINSFGKNIQLKVTQIKEGKNEGKLTLERLTKEGWVPVVGIAPVDCYNLIKPGESLAEAVNRLYQ